MKNRLYPPLLSLILAVSIGGCELKEPTGNASRMQQEQAQTTNVDHSRVQQTLDRQREVFMNSIENGTPDSLLSVYTEEGWMMPPNMKTVEGREAIREYMQETINKGITRILMSSGELEIPDSLTAIETGFYKLYMDDEQVEEGKYMTYWKKEEGIWRMHRDIWNASTPPVLRSDTPDRESP